MALEIGSRLGHYEVTALIGEEGIGQICRATDTKLCCDVSEWRDCMMNSLKSAACQTETLQRMRSLSTESPEF